MTKLEVLIGSGVDSSKITVINSPNFVYCPQNDSIATKQDEIDTTKQYVVLERLDTKLIYPILVEKINESQGIFLVDDGIPYNFGICFKPMLEE